MRTAILILVLLAPAAAAAYHFGPGQSLLALDKASRQMQLAEEQIRQEQFARAVSTYGAALELIPADRVDLSRSVRLERAKAMLQSDGLAEAYDELTALTDEADTSADAAATPFTADLRKTMADAQYYMAWLLRLEGEPRDAWEPDIEASRQGYKLLAEAAGNEDSAAETARLEGDVEAAVRLARMDLSELQALPLPKQCQGCCSGNCQCKCKGKRPGRNPNKGTQKPEDARGAGSGPPPDEKGS